MAKADKDHYQVLSRRLDEILEAVQSPDITIDQAAMYYEEGTKLIAQLEASLKTAENRIKKLTASAQEE